MKFQQKLLAIALGIFASNAIGDDIDIYLNPSAGEAAPHLMLMFDYRTDMTRDFCKIGSDCDSALATSPEVLVELNKLMADNGRTNADLLDATIAVFKVVFDKFSGINVGLMIANNDDGGNVLRGFKEFLENDTNNAKGELVDILNSIPRGGSGKGFFHETSPKEMHLEFYNYLNGLRVVTGDQTANNFGGAGPFHDATVMNPGDRKYYSPFNGDSKFECTKIYSIYATSGNTSGKDVDADSSWATLLGLDPKKLDFGSVVGGITREDFDILEDVAGTQNLKMWFIALGQDVATTETWFNTAMGPTENAGTGDQLMIVNKKNTDLINVQKTLEAAFIEALSVSTTFVAASVPVNVFNRIQTLDNFYIALFEADEKERWVGNIKKLKLVDTNSDKAYDDIQDARGISAFNDADGRLKYEALTFWTDAGDLLPANSDEGEIDGRDGRTVTRGGVGQNIPEFLSPQLSPVNIAGGRQLYMESANGNGLIDFNATSALDADAQRKLLHLADNASVDATTQAKAIELVKWARGIDVDDVDGDGFNTDPRPWLLADSIHSRPLALNYGATAGYSDANPNIRLFMGTNDGFFHIFENTTTAGAESGKEIFAFIPRESLNIIKKIRENTGAHKHPYGIDGEPVALVNDINNNGTIESGEEVYVYVGMRRGGNSYYALDVSNPNVTPKLKWKITQGGDFGELGMTFSTPVVTKVRYEDSARDVLIFGGGFDTRNDTPVKLSESPSGTIKGAAIYIVDARSGELIWKVTGGTGSNSETHHYNNRMVHSIASQVATLDSNQNGITDRLYVGDLSGLVWRIDLPEGNSPSQRESWQATILADLDDNSEAEDRRMFHAPDIVQSKDERGAYDGILVATGDRANPLETDDENYMFFIKDRNIISGSPDKSIPFDDDAIADVTACVSGTESGCSGLDLRKGWKIALSGSGEKGLASPLVAAGKVFFTSYQPATGSSCEPAEGSGQLYVVNLKDGTAAYPTLGRPIDIGPGIPPAVTAIGNDTLIIPSAGIVKLDQTVPNNDKTKLIEAGGKPMHIIYWRETGIDDL
ncbi:MAG TPA: PilC/PilY family type IV pilus protein [Marinagarivorans sp.]